MRGGVSYTEFHNSWVYLCPVCRGTLRACAGADATVPQGSQGGSRECNVLFLVQRISYYDTILYYFYCIIICCIILYVEGTSLIGLEHFLDGGRVRSLTVPQLGGAKAVPVDTERPKSQVPEVFKGGI